MFDEIDFAMGIAGLGAIGMGAWGIMAIPYAGVLGKYSIMFGIALVAKSAKAYKLGIEFDAKHKEIMAKYNLLEESERVQ